MHHEGRAETGAEGDLRFLAHVQLRARHLGRVAADEVVHGLFGSKAGNGRHDAGGIAGEHDDVGGVPGHLLRHGVVDEGQGIAGSGVLGAAVVVQVQAPGDGIVDHILQDGAELARAGEDFRFRLRRQVDDLGVAAVLEVEDAFVAPAVLVVANEAAAGIGAQGGLARAREAEEDGRVILLAHIGRAVHGHHALARQQVVQHGEHALLDLARVACAADDGHFMLEGEQDEGVAARAVQLGHGLEAGDADDGEVRHMAAVFVGAVQGDEHVAGEEAVPGVLGDDAHGQPVARVGAAPAVLHEEVALLHEGLQAVQHLHELHIAEWPVVLAPPHFTLYAVLHHHELVVGGAGRVLAGVDNDGAQIADLPLAAEEDLLVEGGLAQVPVDIAEVREAVVHQAVVAFQVLGDGGGRALDVEIVEHGWFLSGLVPVAHELAVANEDLVGGLGIQRPLHARHALHDLLHRAAGA